MLTKHIPVKIASLVFALSILACSVGAPAPTATPPPTNTPLPSLTPTNTPKPTATPKPTQTPNLVATQQAEAVQTLLNELRDKGYIETTEGAFTALPDFKQDWAQLHYYNWWNISRNAITDFVFSAHFSWSSASTTPDISGCGFGFGLQDNGDHYAVFLDKARILFQMGRGSYSYNVGVSKGSGRMSFGNPAEADFVLVVTGQKAVVSVDGKYVEYTLSADQTSSGKYANSILSGTNKDYGTRCEVTNTVLWTPK